MFTTRKAQRGVVLLLVCCVSLLVGCGESTPTETVVTPRLVATPNLLLPTPEVARQEEPFQGAPKYPDVFLLTSSQRKPDLATFLHTTVPQLDRVNPGLPDPVLAGMLVAIPYDYLVTQSKPFASIAAETGLSRDILFSYNPALRSQENLAQGTRLLMPRLLIVSAETPLSATVERLIVSREALMQANPSLAGTEKLLPGTVLILPPEGQP